PISDQVLLKTSFCNACVVGPQVISPRRSAPLTPFRSGSENSASQFILWNLIFTRDAATCEADHNALQSKLAYGTFSFCSFAALRRAVLANLAISGDEEKDGSTRSSS